MAGQIEQNMELLRSGYEAFARGDLKQIQRTWHPDVVWHAQRLGELSGDDVGWDGFMAFIGRTMEMTAGTCHSQRLLSRVPALGIVARIAGDHHERIDGSGYFRGLEGRALGRESRILAAADAYQAMTSARPHRAALTDSEAAAALDRDAERFGPEAVEAVIQAAGSSRSSRVRRHRPAGLTAREIEVLRLLVRGLTEKEVATELVLSTSTVHTHVTHVYEKAAVSTRAAAAMFAMRHDLIDEEGVP